MKKRGMIEVHFNWIFIMIAGAIIFVFFISIVNKQRSFSEIKTSGTIISNLESILTGAQVSTDTVNVVSMPRVDVGFECNRYFIGSVPKQTKGSIIFSPGLLQSREIITWAVDWNLPYRVDNFLYLTDPELKYMIISDPSSPELGQELYDDLPEELNLELIKVDELDKITDTNNYKVKFIFLSTMTDSVLTEFLDMPDEDVTAINIQDLGSSASIPSTGTIEFLEKDGSTWHSEGTTTHYLKKESLFGAIFSEDQKMYDCVMRKAFRKLNLVTNIYLNRSSSLRNDYGAGSLCERPHSDAIADLEDIRTASESRTGDFPTDISDMDDLKDYAGSIKEANNLAQLRSCVLIY
ncbi:hypothetical protein KY366_01175 [Candidatus Woesearchaeota archaeon]|nr:hypothetical protein [Candidatus Woesearchaeota archaeon]